MSFPTGYEKNVSNSELLQKFLNALFELLRDVVIEGRDSQGKPIFYEELLPHMREAFPELEAHFQRLNEVIPKISPEQINNHALEGRQLSFKLRVVHFFAEKYQQFGGPRVFRKLLGTLEGLLDSIIDASGTGGAIKEFKDFVRNSTTD